jgi:hypothetical protein
LIALLHVLGVLGVIVSVEYLTDTGQE